MLLPSNLIAGSDEIHWIKSVYVIPCNSETEGLYGRYLGAGTRINILIELEDFGFQKVRILKVVDKNPPPPGWGTRVEAGEEIWVRRIGISEGNEKEYKIALSSMENMSKSGITFEISRRSALNEEIMDYYSKFKFEEGSPAFEIIKEVRRKQDFRRFRLWEQSEHAFSDVLYVMAFTKRGRLFLDEFLVMLNEGEVKVLDSLTKECLKRPAPYWSNGTYYYNGLVCMNFYNNLINLLASLIHEGTHAIDMSGGEKEIPANSYYDTIKEYNSIIATFLDHDSTVWDGNSPLLTPDIKDSLELVNLSIETLKEDADRIAIDSEHKAFRAQFVLLHLRVL